MKKLMAVATAAMIGASIVHAADPSEEGVPTSPLKIYSGGFAIGALMSLNEELREVSRQFFRLSMVNTFAVRDHLALFLDVDCFLPKGNVGADLGADAVFSRGDFRPFAGFGVGGHYIGRDEPFGDSFGPSLTAHAGFTFDLSDNVAVRMRLPYHFIFTKRHDHAAGLDFGFIFSNRFKKVRKLDYN
jgi:opacity protein-like surface antigen